MPLYVRLISFTEQGIKNIRNLKRMYEEANAVLEREGVRILETYATLGEYDMVSVIEAPDDKTAMRTSALIGATGTMKIETLPATPIEEFIKALE
jgi:uncharacterized protein with GYD domain